MPESNAYNRPQRNRRPPVHFTNPKPAKWISKPSNAAASYSSVGTVKSNKGNDPGNDNLQQSMNESFCIICKEAITKKSIGIFCSICTNRFHVICAEVTEALLDGISSGNSEWKCETCSRRSTRRSIIIIPDADNNRPFTKKSKSIKPPAKRQAQHATGKLLIPHQRSSTCWWYWL